MRNFNSSNINGYIEGYYGKLLNWRDRRRIIRELSKLKFNYYFYCPKEDPYHRLKWRYKYSKIWLNSFEKFCNIANKNKIKILLGIAPGLDFDFYNYNCDLEILTGKVKELLKINNCEIVLMFDDIEDDFYYRFTRFKSEGHFHAKIANDLMKAINKNIYVVPRVYADEIISKKDNYLEEFCQKLENNVSIFYCGKKIVSKTNNIQELKVIKSLTSNKIILWDNFYANDYCPRKIFLGPYINRLNSNNVMVNLTGMIETDIFLLNVIKSSVSKNDILDIFNKFKIPDSFALLNKYFKTNYDKSESIDFDKINLKKDIENLDILLWKWKTPLSLEWYPYLLGLKQDLLLFYNKISLNRVRKTQTLPFTNIIQNLRKNK